MTYFLDGDGSRFLQSYPAQDQADYQQVAGFLKELAALLRT